MALMLYIHSLCSMQAIWAAPPFCWRQVFWLISLYELIAQLYTLLMLHAGYLGGIPLLLEAGASINLQNKRGHTPLFVAVTGGHFFCVQHLIKVSATV